MKKRLVRCSCATLLVLQSCGAQRERAASAPWTTHTDPAGFTVSVPAGWKIAADASSGRVAIAGPAQERAVIWPVFLPDEMTRATAGILLQRLTAAAGFTANRWSPPYAVTAQAIRMDGGAAVASLAWSSSPGGTAAYLFVTAASRAAYRDAVFGRILSSFRITGRQRPSEPTYVEWRDPFEKAFTVEVPAGWRVEGGLYRFASVDTRSALTLTSPARHIRITFGDKDLPTFTEPNPMLQWSGFREGSLYSPGYGVTMLVKRYIAGPEFVRDYIPLKPARDCANLQFTESRPRPDADQAVNRLYSRFATYGVTMEQRSGDASFTCTEDGKPMAGYHFAGTLRTRSSTQGGIWIAQHLFGFIAIPEKARQAQEVIRHIVGSITVNPEWARTQQQTTMETSRIVSETNQAVSKIIDDTYWTRQRSQDEVSRRRSNAMLGLEDVVDPATGRQLQVEAGADYYWIDHRGTIVGTQTDSLPSLDFRSLTRLP